MITKALISNDQIFENLEVFFIVAQKAKNSLKETFSTEANALIIPLESIVFLLPLGSLHFCLYDSRESIFLLIRIATSKKLLLAKSFAISKKLLLAKSFATSKTPFACFLLLPNSIILVLPASIAGTSTLLQIPPDTATIIFGADVSTEYFLL